MRVALVQLAAYGDCLFATLVARQIKRDHPGCHLTWVIGDKCASILDGNPHVDAVHKIVLSSRDEALSSGWEKAKTWVTDQVRMGNLENSNLAGQLSILRRTDPHHYLWGIWQASNGATSPRGVPNRSREPECCRLRREALPS